MTAQDVNRKFLIKGTAVLNQKKYLESIEPGLFARLSSRLDFGPKGLILASSWYPAEKAYELQEAAAEELGMTSKEIAIAIARYSVKVDLNGVYRFFMKIGGPEMVFKNLPKLGKTYANYFVVELLVNKKNHLQIQITADPSFLDRATWSVEGAVLAILKVCGKSSPTSFKNNIIVNNVNNHMSNIIEIDY